jgi:Flp pilus assembly protein TadD
MGWLALLVLGLAALAAAIKLGVRRPLWSMLGAALMLGAAGYAWQGRPLQPAQPAQPDLQVDAEDPAVVDLRNRMLGTFSGDFPYVAAGDAMARSGNRDAAVRVILGGISHIPESVMLWTALGTALAAHDGGQLSPPAAFAFQQAIRLSPRHPAPRFFLGLADVRSNDFKSARDHWAKALALTPAGASYRPDIAVRLALLDRYLATQRGAGTK